MMATKFITNNETSLSYTIKNLINQSKALDFLVGFFFFSGFGQIYKEVEDIPLRILVGMDADVDVSNRIREYLTYFPEDQIPDSKVVLQQRWFDQVVNVVSKTDSIDTSETQQAFRVFKQKLLNGSLEVRKTLEPNHSKMYLFCSSTNDVVSGKETGKVIVGSSNFSLQGFKARNEVNVYLQDDNDYHEARKIFDDLWSSAVVLVDGNNKDEFLSMIQKKTWLDSVPSPYLVYIKVLYEFFSVNTDERILTPKELTRDSITEFFDVSYQTDAIMEGISKVRKHSGCIIADVVGLGKSIIASAIAANLERFGDVKRTIIICPPHLKSEWETYAQSFYLRGSVVFTPGFIEQAACEYGNSKDLLIIIDEAHRYRNEDTQDYANLHELCAGNKVLLLSATPFNNKPEDIFALIKLFQIPTHSTIQTVNDLARQMAYLIARYKDLKKVHRSNDIDEKEFEERANEIARDIRDILDPVVIRRTRVDLLKINKYREDLESQKISFAKVVPPISETYNLGSLSDLYVDTLEMLEPTGTHKGFVGARYQPLSYLRDNDAVIKKYEKMFDMNNFRISQRNVASFMRQLLVCRFESSKYAFIQSLTNILKSMKDLKRWYEDYKVIPLNDKGKMLDLNKLDDLSDDFDGSLFGFEDYLQATYSEEKNKGLKLIDVWDLTPQFIVDLNDDIKLFEEYMEKWKLVSDDPKLDNICNTVKDSLTNDPKRKIVIFTQFSDTSDYLGKEMEKRGIRVMTYSGKQTGSTRRETIRANFDAGRAKANQRDDYDVLVGTDAISEGISLHRAGTIYNYDIPYNPTRVIQRVGRINRMNKKVFDKLFIYNFFPTTTGEAISHTSEISTFKMKLIQAILGSDTKILTEDETVGGYLSRKFTEESRKEDTVSWDVEYRNELDRVEKSHPEILKAAIELPQRIRVARKAVSVPVDIDNHSDECCTLDHGVLLFTRKGDSFRFSSDNEDANVLPPQKALAIFKTTEEEQGFETSDSFWNSYEAAKAASGLVRHSAAKSKNLQKANAILKIIKDRMKKLGRTIDYDYVDSVIKVANLDSFPVYLLKQIQKIELEGFDEIKQLRELIPNAYISSLLEKDAQIGAMPEIVMLAEEIN